MSRRFFQEIPARRLRCTITVEATSLKKKIALRTRTYSDVRRESSIRYNTNKYESFQNSTTVEVLAALRVEEVSCRELPAASVPAVVDVLG